MTATPTSRRAFLRQGLILAGGLAGGSASLAACAGTPMPSRAGPGVPIASPATTGSTVPARPSRPTLATAQTPTGLLRIENRPGSIGSDTVRDYQLATGVTVDYYEDVLDDTQWLASQQAALSGHDDPGADLLILGDVAVTELLASHRLVAIDRDNVPDRTNLRRELAHPGFDRNRTSSLPWVAGMAGIAYNARQVTGPVTGVGDLFDPRYKGRVTMLADLRDGLGMVMQYQHHSPAQATVATVAQAAARVQISARAGQIARFTGNADFADLIAGQVTMAQVRSGDVAGLRAANPALRFVVPITGSTVFARNMVVPAATHNQVAAESWMEWIYDRPNYAAMIAQVGATAVLSDLGDDLAKIHPALATDPLINPPLATWGRLAIWAPLDPATEQRYTALYTAATR